MKNKIITTGIAKIKFTIRKIAPNAAKPASQDLIFLFFGAVSFFNKKDVSKSKPLATETMTKPVKMKRKAEIPKNSGGLEKSKNILI